MRGLVPKGQECSHCGSQGNHEALYGMTFLMVDPDTDEEYELCPRQVFIKAQSVKVWERPILAEMPLLSPEERSKVEGET